MYCRNSVSFRNSSCGITGVDWLMVLEAESLATSGAGLLFGVTSLFEKLQASLNNVDVSDAEEEENAFMRSLALEL